MNEVRQVVEDVFYADCNSAADGGGAVRGKAYVLPDDAVDAEEAEERRLREVKGACVVLMTDTGCIYSLSVQYQYLFTLLLLLLLSL